MKKAAKLFGALASIALVSIVSAADVDGNWSLYLSAPEGSTTVELKISIDGEEAIGKNADSELQGTYIDGELKLEGELYLLDAGYSSGLQMDARLDGDKLKGRITWDMYSGTVEGTRK